MLPEGEPRWRRRKEARPQEIVAAALAVFAERGFAAARLEDVARRAGVSKGALYLYFETKEDLFRAVVREAVAPNVEVLEALAKLDMPFAEIAPRLLGRAAEIVGAGPVGAVAKMVIGEARNFPEIARVWHDALVARALGALTAAIERAQARGEVKAGDARVYAVSLVSPLLMGVLWRETFVPVGAAPFDLPALAAQHAKTVLGGMLR